MNINKFYTGGNIIDHYNSKQKQTLNRTIDYFRSKGWNDASIIGVLANFHGESVMNPDTTEVGGAGYGIAQFSNDMRNHLFDLYGQQPTLEQQLEYIDNWKNQRLGEWHFTKDGKHYTKKYKGQKIDKADMNYRGDKFYSVNSDNPEDYFNSFIDNFESPKNKEQERIKRLKYIKAFSEYVKSYHPSKYIVPQHTEQPDALRVRKPIITRRHGGTLIPRNAVERFKMGRVLKAQEGENIYYRDPGSIQQAPTTRQRIEQRTKDIAHAAGQFVPFLGTILDVVDMQPYATSAGVVRDVAIPQIMDKGRVGGRPGNRRSYNVYKRGHGWIRAGSKPKPGIPLKSFRGLGKALGLVGMVLDTPNIVSDFENLKRAVGLPYNNGLIIDK